VTLEDHVLPGGYGSSVLELFAQKGVRTPVVRIGWPDEFIEHASSVDYLREKHGLTVENTVQRVRMAVQQPAAAAEPSAAAGGQAAR
jgi:1-deoxy-D-xylulose-5-phosphate synthase